jgi:hydrogenase maturation protease
LNVLVIGIGNPSRGDDALGPMLIERLAELTIPGVELLTDFQLQVEYLLDLHGRDAVIFIDASVSCSEPYQYTPAAATELPGITTHSLSPEALLGAYTTHYGAEPPPAWILAIRGYAFELGEALSPAAVVNLEAAVAFLNRLLLQEKSASTSP